MKIFYKVYIMIFCSIVVTAVLMFVVSNFYNVLKNRIQEQIGIALRETAEQNAKILETKINDNLNFLTHISEEIAPILASNREKAMQFLVRSTKQLHFDNMAIVGTDGTGYNIDGKKLDVGDREYFRRTLKGERLLSNPVINRITNERTSIFSVPIYYRGKITSVLLTVYSVKKMNELFSNSSFKGKSYMYVTDLNGDVIINSDYKASQTFTVENIFDAIQTSDNGSKKMAKTLQSKVKEKKHGSMRLENKVNKYVYYYPTTINDWYIFIILPIDAADNILNLILKQTIKVSIINFGLFLILFIFIFYFHFRSRQELVQIAYFDKLTGGNSFAKFRIEAGKTVKKYFNSNHSSNIAVLSVNIDNFKNLNSLFGHEEGDKILRFVWTKLNNIKMRDELHARYIADQFYALLYLKNRESLLERLSYFSEALQSYDILGYKVKASVGIYEIRDRSENIDDMINFANIAMKTVKGKSNGFYAFFDDNIKDEISRKNIIESQMIKAMQNKEFVVFYNPQFDPQNKKIIGAETVIKWIKKDGTVIPESEFSELFEKNFFITTLDKYVLFEICKKQKIWINTGLTPLPISVGLSKLHFYNPNFINEIKQIVDLNTLPLKRIKLEIPEIVLYENRTFAADSINELKKLGFSITIKNFVIRYSSVITLKDVPVDTVKLNKKVIGSIDDEINRKITANILQLAKSLGVKTAVEEIHSEEEYDFFKSIKCDVMQGDYFSSLFNEKELEQTILNMQSHKIYESEI